MYDGLSHLGIMSLTIVDPKNVHRRDHRREWKPSEKPVRILPMLWKRLEEIE
jgi:hypothetical protein